MATELARAAARLDRLCLLQSQADRAHIVVVILVLVVSIVAVGGEISVGFGGRLSGKNLVGVEQRSARTSASLRTLVAS